MADPRAQPFGSAPGQPVPPGAIDPELVALRGRRAPVSAVLSVCVIGLCLYLVAALWSDLAFSRQGPSPTSVDDPRALLAPDFDNAYVELRAVPDRTFVAHVAERDHGVAGQRVAPVLGTDDHLWLLADSNPWSSTADSETYRGRVRRLGGLALDEPLRAYVDDAGAARRYVAPTALRAALIGAVDAIAAPGGRSYPLAADTQVSATERLVGQAQLWAAFTGQLPDVAAWRAALEQAGIADAESVRKNRVGALFLVRAPDGLDALEARLAAARLYSARLEPVDKLHTAPYGALSGGDAGLAIAGAAPIPWSRVLGATVALPHAVPGDARVLIVGDDPAAYWYALPLVVVLLLFAALFAWALARAVRATWRQRAAVHSQP